ncbi:MAG TPA: serine hydrolase [Gemmatimonadaceae bacterium]|nr:serine hydrolase [Gemmatimonadaceae bacterium]
MHRAPLIAVALLLSVSASAVAQRPGGTLTDPGSRIDSVFRAFGASSPGCAVAVSQRGTVVTQKAYGMAHLEHGVPNTPATIFEAGSVSKQVVAAAVVLLALDGKLSLDDDVRTHLPELPDYGAPITIRHLINHTSGLRDWGSVAALGGWPRGTRVYSNDLVLHIARHQRALNYAPGTYWSYTNTGYNLMALVVGRVSGVPLAEFTRVRLFEPLGMTQTSWRDDFARVVKGRATGYEPDSSPGVYRLDMPFDDAYGNGGLLTTVHDLLRWTANLESGAVGGARFITEMHRQGVLTSGRTVEYAGGLFVTSYRGIPEVSHSGATAGYRAFLSRYPAQGVAVAVLCNAANASATELGHQVADGYLGDALVARADADSASSPPPALAPARLAALAGVYRHARDGQPVRLVARDGQLRTEGGSALRPLAAGRFRLGGNVLIFDSVATGAARAGIRMLTGDGDTLRYEPVAPFAPTPAQLAEYVGTYESDEADGTFVVSVERDSLLLRDRYGRAMPAMRPDYADAFGNGRLGIRFVRDDAGRVTALSARDGRAWDVRFVRRR